MNSFQIRWNFIHEEIQLYAFCELYKCFSLSFVNLIVFENIMH